MTNTNNITALLQQKGVTLSSSPQNEMTAPKKRKRIYESVENEEPNSNGDQTDNNQVTNGDQTDNNQVTNGDQNKETDNKRITKPITNGITNGQQTDNKRITKISFFELIGLQKKVTLYVYESCKLTRSDISGPITLESMSEYLQSPKGSIKMTTNRLRKKNVIETVSQKEGRGGFTKYRLDNAIYQEILHYESDNKRVTNGDQTDNKRITKPITEPITSSSSIIISSSIEKNNNTSSEAPGNFSELPNEWQQIDHSGLADFGYKVFQNEILGIYRAQQDPGIPGEPLVPEIVQDSFNQMAYDLKTGAFKKAKPKHNPKATLIGGLMKKMPYTALSGGYISPEEQERQRWLERKREEVQRRQHQEEEFFQLTFEEFYNLLTGNQIKLLCPQFDHPDMRKNTILAKFREKYFLFVRECFRNKVEPSISEMTLDSGRPDPLNQLDESVAAPSPRLNIGTEAIALKAKLEQLKKLDEVEPSAETKEAIQCYEQKLRDFELGIEVDARTACDAQFGPRA